MDNKVIVGYTFWFKAPISLSHEFDVDDLYYGGNDEEEISRGISSIQSIVSQIREQYKEHIQYSDLESMEVI